VRSFGRHLELSGVERRLADPEVIESLGELDRLPRALLPAWVVRRPPLPLSPVIAGNLRRVQAAGITVAAGSDAGNIGTLHGPSLHRELELMVEAGLSPMEALMRSARRARVGKLADFVILDADPLADIRNTTQIRAVIRDGKVFDPQAILEGLEED
jgi:hypothetical protein